MDLGLLASDVSGIPIFLLQCLRYLQVVNIESFILLRNNRAATV